MTSLLLALQFLTVIPVKVRNFQRKSLVFAPVYFPLIGLLLGLVLSGALSVLSGLGLNKLAGDAAVVVLLAILTGGMHLDGLADTCDALAGAKNKEEALGIMRDPHIGAMGAIAISCAMLLKVSLLSCLSAASVGTALILMCVISRWSLVAGMFFFPYARQEGKAKIFMENIDHRIFFWATAGALVSVLLFWRLRGMLLLFTAALFIALFCGYLRRRLGGVTGDTLGALNELVEIIVLFCICIL